MATIRRRCEWKLGTSGQYERTLGWLGLTDEKPTRPKFYLGRDEASARARSAKLETMWASIENLYADHTKARWGEYLDIAKAVAKGETVYSVPRWFFGGGETYLHHLCKLANLFPVIQFVPGDAEHLASGVEAHQTAIAKAEQEIAKRQKILKVAGAKAVPTGGPALHEALDAFKAYLKTDPKLKDPTTGEMKAWYYKREDMLDRMKDRHADLPLAALDLEECEKIINYWRGRPPVKTRKTTMAVESALKQIEEFKRFAKWLHRSKFDWRKPEDFDDLDCSVEATANEVAKRADTEQVATFTIEELRKILPHTLGVSRAIFLLGLNCGFGGGECGTLTMREVYLRKSHPKADLLGIPADPNDSFIRRIRRKNLVYGEHWLWPETVEALEWLIARRKRVSSFDDDSLLFVTDEGSPMFKLTKGGNCGQQFQNMWYDVVKHPVGVRKLSLGKLRKSAGDMITSIANGEVMSVFLCHGTPVHNDELSDVYSNRHFEKVFAAQKEARRRFDLFKQAG